MVIFCCFSTVANAIECSSEPVAVGEILSDPSNSAQKPSADIDSSVADSNDDDVEVPLAFEEVHQQVQTDTKSFKKIPVTSDCSGLYLLGSRLSGRVVLDIAGASAGVGANAQVWFDNATPAQRFRFLRGEDGYYTIENAWTGKVLDVAGASRSVGANVQQWEPNATDAQKWSIVDNLDGSVSIISKLTLIDGEALVLDVQGGDASSGSNVQLYSSNDTMAQKWTMTAITEVLPSGVYHIRSGLSEGIAIDIAGDSVSRGANVQIESLNDGDLDQKFQVTFDDKTGYYTVMAAGSGLALDVSGGSSIPGSNVQQWTKNNTEAQQWVLKKNDNGTYEVKNGASGLALDVAGAQASPGTNVQVWESNGTFAQAWSFEAVRLVDDGLYTFACAADASYVLDVTGASLDSEANIQVWHDNGTWAQIFAVTRQDDGYYLIKNLNSGLLVDIGTESSGAGANVEQGGFSSSDAGGLWMPIVSDGGLAWVSKSGFALDVAGGVLANGTNVQVWAVNETLAQSFVLKPASAMIPEGVYTLESALDPSYVIDVVNGSVQSGALVQAWPSNGTAAQKFYVSANSDGTYRIMCVGSNKALDVKDYFINPSDGSGTVQQWTIANNTAQRWDIRSTNDGYFSIFSKCGDGNSCLDVSGGRGSVGGLINVVRSNGGAAQKFGLRPTSSYVAYRQYGVSLDDMVSYQKTNPYLSGVSDADIRKAVDPSNYRTSEFYQFADLRYSTGLTADQLNVYLSSKGSGGVLDGQGGSFAVAAKRYGLNEVYLVTHTCLESGWGASLLARGRYYDGSTYRYLGNDGNWYTCTLAGYPAGTYYNLFGIGAYDNDPDRYGIEMAIKSGWNSVDAAIDGSANWIAANYVYRSSYAQPSLYEMKWDVAETEAVGQRGYHQYATDILWAKKIASLMAECYTECGIENPSVAYFIPRYS